MDEREKQCTVNQWDDVGLLKFLTEKKINSGASLKDYLGIETKGLKRKQDSVTGVDENGTVAGAVVKEDGGVHVGERKADLEIEDVKAKDNKTQGGERQAGESDPSTEQQKSNRSSRKRTTKLNIGRLTKKLRVDTKMARVPTRTIYRTKDVEKSRLKMQFLNAKLAQTKKELIDARETIKELQKKVKKLESTAARGCELEDAVAGRHEVVEAAAGVTVEGRCKPSRAPTVAEHARDNKAFMQQNSDVLGFKKKGFMIFHCPEVEGNSERMMSEIGKKIRTDF
jgi:hypothetical protein